MDQILPEEAALLRLSKKIQRLMLLSNRPIEIVYLTDGVISFIHSDFEDVLTPETNPN